MSLIAEIETAFSDARRPSDEELFSYDDEGALDILRGRRWQDVPDDELDYHSCALATLSAHGFAYFLPAFMRAALRHPHLGFSDAVVQALTPPNDDPARPSFAARWTLLSVPQRTAAVAFLHAQQSSHPFDLGPAISALERSLRIDPTYNHADRTPHA